ncbi:DNA-directed RNA polymerase specialized sigma subunit, sigma24 family [Butyrivibrio hungatei DSM 14810]|uniref:DNA-directed RNA polymerase specialized sigma subunit, sigma24 family n=1 Tax=Butyrivibrio hungatei DSM 14810 TaxID=1121132 RepID=A0A1M7SUC5_9FIRM|nr:sigma-70 family RNA polymerase sigma factor [Butyrivibrio hungatei]SHN61986.1 DNA-directed RNA polymerase specialized sigma subunit, sigma24 family [Butyrivibrio hungatei DSM 14810]
MNSYASIITSCKSKDGQGFLLLAEKFSPLIKKYTRLLYKNEAEDVKQEMLLALWEASQKIEKYDNEGECTRYFFNALKCKFLELYRKSKNENETSFLLDDSIMENEQSEEHLKYAYANLKQDIIFVLSNYPTVVKDMCLKMIFNDMSDSEIAKNYHVSRQYANRIRRNFRKDMSIFWEV